MTNPTTDLAARFEAKREGFVPNHEFKSHPSVFWPASRGEKTFEYRRDDRGGYEVGQTVRLRCYTPGVGYTPVDPLDRVITNILRGGEFELPAGYCILSLAPVPETRDMARADAAGGADGFVLVPAEATEEMWQAGLSADAHPGDSYSAVYRAMIAAAPPPPAQQGSSSQLNFSRDFELMLARIIHRHGKGLDITETIAGAKDLLARKGSLSPLREDSSPLSRASARNAEFLGLSTECFVGGVSPSSSPVSQGETVDLAELERLSAAATPGLLSISGSRKRYHEDSCVIIDGPNCLGLFALATANGSAALEALADARFAVALWNAYRSGHLAPASLSASLGRGEGRAGATPMGSGSRPSDQAASHPAPAGFDPSRGWQPITTAPMTTDPILITGWAFADDDWNSGYVGYWRDAPAHKAKERYQCIGYMVQPASGHRCVGHRNGPVNVTHWMPLPPAPCDGSGEAGETHSGSTEGDSAVGVAEAPHPQSPSLSEVEAKAVLAEPYLIRKGGYYYRPNRCGYTATPHDAGHYTREEAEAEASIEPWHMSAVKLSDALATLTASQEQDGEVRS